MCSAAVILLENEPVFDAGNGLCLNAVGEIEMDASVMDYTSLKAGMYALHLTFFLSYITY